MESQIKTQSKLFSDSGQSSFEQPSTDTKAVEVTINPKFGKRKGVSKGYIAKITNSRVLLDQWRYEGWAKNKSGNDFR